MTSNIQVSVSKEDIANALNNLKIEYVEISNQIVCVIENNSNIDLTFGYDLVFYEVSNYLVSIAGITGIRDGFFKGDSKVFYFDKTQMEYSYYKIRFINDVWGQYNYENQKIRLKLRLLMHMIILINTLKKLAIYM